jgi:hypothetical protein
MGSPFAFRIHIVPWIDAQHIPQFLTTGILVVEESASNSTSLWRPTHGRLESWLPELATLLEVVALRQLTLSELMPNASATYGWNRSGWLHLLWTEQ